MFVLSVLAYRYILNNYAEIHVLLFSYSILQNQALNVMRRKMESDLIRLSNENEELISEFRAADERAKKAVTDVSLALILQKHSALIQLL